MSFEDQQRLIAKVLLQLGLQAALPYSSLSGHQHKLAFFMFNQILRRSHQQSQFTLPTHHRRAEAIDASG
ncbi:MAG TPA: hypothetical protein VI776_04740 [Anaerolineales bacterium]|nr:hypothetical protein [Anaerolineales bacterium]